MKKLVIILLTALIGGLPLAVQAQSERPQQEVTAASIAITEQTIRVQNAEGQVLKVYSLTGMVVATYRIESSDVNLHVNLTPGCYILKLGKLVRKVQIS